MTLKELIAISGDVEIMKAQFHLRSGIVNHDLVYESQAKHGNRIPDDVHSVGIDRQTNRSIMSSCFAGELVNYVVLQNVAQNITTGDKALYELQVNIKGNSVFWGKAEDTIANNLFKSNRTSHNPMPGLLAGISQNVMARPTKVSSFMEGAKRMLSTAWDNRETLATIAQSAAPMLLAAGLQDDDDDEPE